MPNHEDGSGFYKVLADIKAGRLKVWQPSTDPLPKWTKQGDGYGSSSLQSVGYTCDDPAEQAFALGVMMMTGFSIPDFDVWLDSIGLCGAREELMIRRQWAREALHANNEESVRRHLEWLHLRRRGIEHEGVLLPLAQRDEKRQAGTKKPRRPDIDQWIARQLELNPAARSPTLWNAAPDWITDYLGVDRFAKRVTAARRVASK
ncbi:MAG TPA: hypothetical protein VIM06_02650 [Rhodanobacter sp.]